MDTNINPDKIKEIIEQRFTQAPAIIKKSFPDVLQNSPISWITLSPPDYLMVVFLNPGYENRIKEYTSKRYDPFPGLITLENKGAAFRVDKSRNMLIQSCTVNNSYALSLGSDSTIILSNHKQSIKTQELGQVDYDIPLAYIVSYGDEINKATIYDYFDGLIAYSINIWRGSSA